jgi:hypothetical protein
VEQEKEHDEIQDDEAVKTKKAQEGAESKTRLILSENNHNNSS